MKSGKGKVAVGLSGGVDSAVSAYLLKMEGYEVTGVYLTCWDEGPHCRAREDRADALKVALHLGIPFKTLDFQKEYKERVIDRFYKDYERGLTPNPDIWCNSEIKFGLFYQWAMDNGYDFVATGHYAAIKPSLSTCLATGSSDSPAESDYLHTHRFGPADSGDQAQNDCVSWQQADAPGLNGAGKPGLYIPKDNKKDQTYFLYRLKKEQLEHILFPLADMLKTEVRETARKAELPVAEKKDSVGICFIGDIDVQEFLRRRLKEVPGEVVDSEGRVIGRHKGVWFYTIGQRGGFEFTPEYQRKFGGEVPPFYVSGKDATTNRLIAGYGAETLKQTFKVGDIHWINQEKAEGWGEVRIRHTGRLVNAELKRADGMVEVVMENADRGIAPGQSTVFYSKEGEVLGGGVIV